MPLLHVISVEVHIKLIKVVPVMLKCNATRNCNKDLLVMQGIALCWHVLKQGTDTISTCLEIC